MFLVDSSRGVPFDRMKSFSKSLLRYFKISPEGTHVAYAVYANSGAMRFSFPLSATPRYRYDTEMVNQNIDSVRPLPGDERNIRTGLQVAQSGFSQPRYGARPDARKVGILQSNSANLAFGFGLIV